MKILALCATFLFLMPTVFAFGGRGGPDLCPRFRCVGEPLGTDYHRMEATYNYGNDLETTRGEAMRDCEERNGSCSVSCEKFTGPVLAVPWACVSQW